MSREYTHLLTSQLESQRQYFEELRAHDALQHQRELSQATCSAEAHTAELTALRKRCARAIQRCCSRWLAMPDGARVASGAVMPPDICACSAEAAEAQSQSRQKQANALEGKLKAVQREHGVFSELNRSLIANQQAWKDKVAAAEKRTAEVETEAKVRRLLMACDFGGGVGSAAAVPHSAHED